MTDERKAARDNEKVNSLRLDWFSICWLIVMAMIVLSALLDSARS